MIPTHSLKLLSQSVKFFTFVFLLLCTLTVSRIHGDNVGLAIVATGKYIEFVKPLIESAEKYFCKNHNVTYYVFTDQDFDAPENVVCLPHSRLGWPYDTMMRYEAYFNHKDYFSEEDYIFAIDADMLFVDTVGDEILSDHTAVMHPGFVNKKGTYETNPQSTACVYPYEGQYYFCGGVYGGSRERFFHICKTTLQNIYQDLSNGIIAVWHDESHWNRYCIDHKPVRVMTPSYCFPDEGDYGNYHKRILALTKRNVQEYRDNN
jgi:histo-blood group ABO system transferase